MEVSGNTDSIQDAYKLAVLDQKSVEVSVCQMLSWL